MKKIITSLSLLSICLLTNCSNMKGSNPEKAKIKNVSKKVTQPKHRSFNSNRTAEDLSSAGNRNISNKTQPRGRTIEGFIEPDVTQLPNNKDLQESNNVAPALKPPSPKVPLKPLLKAPSD